MKTKTSITKLYIFTFVILMLQFSTFSKNIIKVGVYENAPKIFTDKSGNVSGFWADITNYIAQKEGLDIQWVHGAWSECLDRLEKGEIDILPDTGWTPERNNKYLFSQEVVQISWVNIYKTSDSKIENILDLEKKKIGGLRNSFDLDGPKGLRKLLNDFAINTEIIEMESYLKIFEALEDGIIDAGLVDKDFASLNDENYNIHKTSIIFQPAKMLYSFTKNSDRSYELIKIIDRELNELKSNNESIYFQSLEKHLNIQPLTSFIPKWVYWVLVVSVLIISLLYFINSFLRKTIFRKTNELSVELEKTRISQEALTLNEEKYRALFEDAADCILISDVYGNIINFNKHAYQDYGYSKEEFSKLNVRDLDAIESNDKVKFRLRQIEAVGYDRFISKHKKKNGEVIDVQISGKKININDKILIQSIYRNIDDYEKLKHRYKEEKTYSENLAETAGAVIISLDLDENITSFNRFAETLTGYKKSEVLGNNWFDMFIPESYNDNVPKVFLDILRSQEGFSTYENPIICKNGSERIIKWSNSLIKDNNNHVTGLLSVGIDVTDKINIEERLKQAELNAKFGYWKIDLNNNNVNLSDGAKEIFGIKDESINLTMMRNIPLEKYRISNTIAFNELVTNETPYDVVYEFKTKDSEDIKIINSTATYNKDLNSVFGVVKDITERKKYQK